MTVMAADSKRASAGHRVPGAGRRPPRAGIALGVALATGVAAAAFGLPSLTAQRVAEPRSPAFVPPGRYFEEVGERVGIVHDDSVFATENPIDDWSVGGGVAIADVDRDGDPDVLITSLGGSNRLFLNRGDGTFDDGSERWAVASSEARTIGAAFADHDADGDPDLFLVGSGRDRVLRNDGDHFTDVSAASGLDDPGRSSSISFADYDRDGDLDAYVTDWWSVPTSPIPRLPPWMRLPWPDGGSGGSPTSDRTDVVQPGHLFRNEGDGTFRDASELLPVERRAASSFLGTWSDFDADGDPDLYVVNDFGAEVTPNQLFRNDGPDAQGGWKFTPVTDECGCSLVGAGMGLALGDVDRDGRQDMYVTNMLWPPTHTDGEHLYRNLGGLVFEDVTAETASRPASEAASRVVSWGPEFLDIDNDGWLDLYVPFGHMPPDDTPDVEDQPNALLMNEGGTFRIVEGAGVEDRRWSRGVGVVDLDLDGCLDLVVANLGQRAGVYRNRCASGNHWLGLRLRSPGPNRAAVGAVARVTADGVTQRGEVVAGGTSVHSSRWKVLHFGLGASSAIERVDVDWPSGRKESFAGLLVDHYLTLAEGTGEPRG
ncbi:MAG: CRTAC1 family protein [Deltaproteobacteria bacterium]|nr:CRTAC1 family protein [Deltaproteobacteria bacterium]